MKCDKCGDRLVEMIPESGMWTHTKHVRESDLSDPEINHAPVPVED